MHASTRSERSELRKKFNRISSVFVIMKQFTLVQSTKLTSLSLTLSLSCLSLFSLIMDGFRTTERLQRAMHLVASSSDDCYDSSTDIEEEKEKQRQVLEVVEKCKLYEHATVIPYEFIKALSSLCVQIAAKRESKGGKEEYMIHNLLRGSEVLFKAPKKRAPKTPEFARKLDRIRERLEEEKYEAMVADVTKATGISEKSARERRTSSIGYLIRNDLGMAVHVMTLMAACFVGGFIAGAHVFPEFGWEIHFVCGTVGAICCLFMEAALFIVRGVREDERDQKNREQQDADGSMITKSKNEFANNSRSSNNDSTMKKEN